MRLSGAAPPQDKAGSPLGCRLSFESAPARRAQGKEPSLEGYAWGLGVEEISVHASRTARPFFQRRGYQTAAAQQVERRGVLLENFVMKKSLRRQDG